MFVFFFQAEDGIRDLTVTGVQTCALPISSLRQLAGPFDFVLIDLWKNLYVPVFELLHPKLAHGALIVADNMLQPESARADARAYRQRVRAAADMSSVLLAVGNGLELSRYQ